jgi:TRAP-type uncharacterized transport system substrate-binding protein
MATRLEEGYKEGVHAVIHFLHARHVSVAEIHSHLVDVCGEEIMRRQSAVKRCSDLKSGQVGTTNDGSGRPTTVSTPKKKARIEAAILENRRVTVSEHEHGLGLLDGSIASIIQEFGFHKVCV